MNVCNDKKCICDAVPCRADTDICWMQIEMKLRIGANGEKAKTNDDDANKKGE